MNGWKKAILRISFHVAVLKWPGTRDHLSFSAHLGLNHLGWFPEMLLLLLCVKPGKEKSKTKFLHVSLIAGNEQ